MPIHFDKTGLFFFSHAAEACLLFAASVAFGLQKGSIVPGILFLIELFRIFYYIRAKRILTHLHILLSEDNGSEAEKTARDSLSWIPYSVQIADLMNEYVEWRIRKNNELLFDKETEYAALQNQINPHFLYNTLDSIRSDALISGEKSIAKIVETLSSFFRYNIGSKGGLVPLRDELDNVRDYMLIQKYRFNNRFSLEIELDEDHPELLDAPMPSLLLQPIVENSIYHGFEDMSEHGIISIDVSCMDTDMVITISDNGKGMSIHELDALNQKINSSDLRIQSKAHARGGIALPNCNKRIQLSFGKRYGLSVYSTEGAGTDVEIVLPLNWEKKEQIE